MKWLLYVILIFITTFACCLGVIFPQWDLKSFSIYLKRITNIKLPFKNNIAHPKFKLMIIIIVVHSIMDIVFYVLFIFLYDNNLFLRICLIYSLVKIFSHGINFTYIFIKDRIYYKKEKKLSNNEINSIINNIKEQHPNFFQNKIEEKIFH